MLRAEIKRHLDDLLEVARFRDYCPNGMQVEGRPDIHRIVCGVSATQALLDAAVAEGADAVLVHHGWFWRGEDGRVVGFRRNRLKTLLENDISLFAYHLPLDAHVEFGNNAQLAKLMGWTVDGRFAEQDIGFFGHAPCAVSAEEIAQQLAARLGRAPMLVGDATRMAGRIAWCTGAAQGYLEQAIVVGADVFVSGEISEQTVHLARESGVPYIAAGHHATERYGVQALGAHLARHFGVECRFIDIDSPV